MVSADQNLTSEKASAIWVNRQENSLKNYFLNNLMAATRKKDNLKSVFLKNGQDQDARAQEVNVSDMISPVANIKVIGCG